MITKNFIENDPLLKSASFEFIIDFSGIPIIEATKVQKVIAKTMAALATINPIDAVLNLGDNIYYTGVLNVNDYRFEVRGQPESGIMTKWHNAIVG